MNYAKPLEDVLTIKALLSLQGKTRETLAATVQQAGPDTILTFAFEVAMLHVTATTAQYQAALTALQTSLRHLSSEVDLIWEYTSQRADPNREATLQRLIATGINDTQRALARSEQQRTQMLQSAGVRKQQRCLLWLQLNLHAASDSQDDWLTQTLKPIVKLGLGCYGAFTAPKPSGTTHVPSFNHQQVQSVVQQAEKVIEHVLLKLRNTGKLQLSPLSLDELWVCSYRRLHPQSPIPAIPHVLYYADGQLTERVQGSRSMASVLSHGPLPKAHYEHVVLEDRQFVKWLLLDELPLTYQDARVPLSLFWEHLIRLESSADVTILVRHRVLDSTLIRGQTEYTLRIAKKQGEDALLRNNYNPDADEKGREAEETILALHEGDKVLVCAVVIQVTGASQMEVERKAKLIQAQLPFATQIESIKAWKVWLTTLLGCTPKPLLTDPFNEWVRLLVRDVFLPLVGQVTGDQTGFEWRADQGGTPIYLDLLNHHVSILIIAQTGGGKSVQMGGLMAYAVINNIAFVVLDFPRETSSSYQGLFRILPNSANFDIRAESLNLLDLPDWQHLPAQQQAVRFAMHIDAVTDALVICVLGSTATTSTLKRNAKALFMCAVRCFYQDPDIAERFRQAQAADMGSAVQQQAPTLRDLTPFLTVKRLQQQLQDLEFTPEIRQALAQIVLQLKSLCDGPLGQAIARPSSIQATAAQLLFSLRHLKDDDEAAIHAANALLAVQRKALSEQTVIVFIDEGSILFNFPEISRMVGKLCANGRGNGIRVVIASQDPDAIAASPHAAQVLQNIDLRLIGRIQPTAVASCEAILQCPRTHLLQATTFPRATEYSLWLHMQAARVTPVRFYASQLLMGAMANSPHEIAQRRLVLAQIADPLEATIVFAWLRQQAQDRQQPLADTVAQWQSASYQPVASA